MHTSASSRRRAIAAATGGLLALTTAVAPAAMAKGKPAKGGGSTPPAELSHVHGGEATVVTADIAGLSTTLVQAGPIDPGGGVAEDSLLSAEISGIVANVLSASVVGDGDVTVATASAADVGVALDPLGLGADVVIAEAAVACVDGTAVATGDSTIAGLAADVLGLPVDVVVDGSVNQTIDLGVGTLVLNEQIVTGDGPSAAITTNALHLTVDTLTDGLVDVVIASATASMVCDPGAPAGAGDGDWFTGGGTHHATPTGDRASFGVAGGVRNGGYWGHLNFVDHSGLHVKAISITDYEVIDDTTRRMAGTAKAGKSRVSYEVVVSDNGEPGTADTFSLTLSNGYTAAGVLDGGNIQLHPTH